MKRQIIKVDDDLCNGCGECIPNCHEGALQIIDGKVRLVSELMCDGLGACIGHCPTGALEIEEREAQPYDEVAVLKEMVPKGKNLIAAHLKHLKDHGEDGYLKQGIDYLLDVKKSLPFEVDEIITEVQQLKTANTIESMKEHIHGMGGCPGSREMAFNAQQQNDGETGSLQSQLRQWPVQMHLINPRASYFQQADVVLAADCVAFAMGNFHQKYLKGKSIAIACPKLDDGLDIYTEKIKAMIDEAQINTLTVMIMQVPCCSGLLQIASQAAQQAGRKVPVKSIVVSLQGEVLTENWV